tara:strand:+ start:2073 stop:2222 length:150 start_codon:yes stop_codon:yes gene_type:complete
VEEDEGITVNSRFAGFVSERWRIRERSLEYVRPAGKLWKAKFFQGRYLG